VPCWWCGQGAIGRETGRDGRRPAPFVSDATVLVIQSRFEGDEDSLQIEAGGGCLGADSSGSLLSRYALRGSSPSLLLCGSLSLRSPGGGELREGGGVMRCRLLWWKDSCSELRKVDIDSSLLYLVNLCGIFFSVFCSFLVGA
jgi:hypothetical protein